MKFLAISALALGLFVPQVEVSAKHIITQVKREQIGHPLVAMPMTMGLLVRPSIPPVVTFIGATMNTSAATIYTFTAVNIGTASSDRLVVVSAQAGTNNSRTISTVTIGGNAATILANSTAAPNPVCMAQLLVTTGTTANIVVTWNGGVSRTRINVWTVTGYQSATPLVGSSFPGTTTTAPSCTINSIPARSGLVVGAFNQSSTAGSVTVTSGGTNIDDDAISSNHFYGGHLNDAASGNRTFTITFPNTGSSRIIAAAWR